MTRALSPESTMGRLALCALLQMVALPVFATRVPLVTSSCSVAEFGATSPSGLTFNSNARRFAATDDVGDLVYVFDAQCNLDNVFSTGDFGASSPQGVAYDPSSDRYAIVDALGDEMYFTTAAGVMVGQCDLASIGATNPVGIAYAAGTATYAVTDSDADEVFIVDDSQRGGGPCNVLSQFDTAIFGGLTAQGITFVDGTAQYAQVDSGADEVFIVDSSFVLEDQYDTASGFGSSAPEGIAYVSLSDSYYFVDSSTDLLTAVDARGTSEFLCSTAAVGSTSPIDVVFVAGTNEIAFADDVSDTVYVLDRSTCSLNRLFNIAALGIQSPAGMTYIPQTDQLVITDTGDDEIYFVGYTTTMLEGQCDIAATGLQFATGIDLISALGQFVLADTTVDAVAVTDLDCNVIHQNSLEVLGSNLDAGSSQAVGYQPGLGRFLIVDNADDQVYLNNFEGFLEADFDLLGLGLGNATGISVLAGGDTFLVSVSDLDAIYRLVVPGVNEAVSLSGNYVTSGGITVVLRDRGEGRFTGSVLLGADPLPVFGQFDAGSGDISFGVVSPSGTPLALAGAVAGDLNTINLPQPLGVLTRTF